MITIITIFFLIMIAGISKSIMDTVDFHFKNSIFDNIKNKKIRNWFNESEGWKNKYKDRDAILKIPAFIFSTTMLVFLTDSWHFFQFIMLSSLFLSMVLASTICITLSWYYLVIIFFISKSIMTLTFELFWKNVWKK